jgi:hypothetical protein
MLSPVLLPLLLLLLLKEMYQLLLLLLFLEFADVLSQRTYSSIMLPARFSLE